MTHRGSPYEGLPARRWAEKTQTLLRAHPLNRSEIVRIVLKVWNDILVSKIGGFQIGRHLLAKPQIMGFFLHELIPLELARRHPGAWRGDKSAKEKDLVHIPNPELSVEIKTSSHPSQIFGNRSYAQKSKQGNKTRTEETRKAKSGYYLAVNFEKFTDEKSVPAITRIRFGWLDHTDWVGQKSETGQQSRLSRNVERYKLVELYRRK